MQDGWDHMNFVRMNQRPETVRTLILRPLIAKNVNIKGQGHCVGLGLLPTQNSRSKQRKRLFVVIIEATTNRVRMKAITPIS